MWIIVAFLSIAAYSIGEIFQKLGSGAGDKDSEWKMFVWFGIFNGLFAVGFKVLGFVDPSVSTFDFLSASPVMILSPLLYALSLIAIFLSYKFIPASIGVPIHNTNGIFSFIGVIVLFIVIGQTDYLASEVTVTKVVISLLVLGLVYVSGILESQGETSDFPTADGGKLKKYVFAGILLSLLAALFDALSSIVDVYIFSELSETYDYLYVNCVLTFLFGGIIYLYVCIKEKRICNVFGRSEKFRLLGALGDALGTLTSMIAVSLNPVYADIFVSSYCAFSVILANRLLKEKFVRGQKVCVILIICCIMLFAVIDEF